MKERRYRQFMPCAAFAFLLFGCFSIVSTQAVTQPGLYYAAPDGTLKEEGPARKELLQFGFASDIVSFILILANGENVEYFRVEDAAKFIEPGSITQVDFGKSRTNFTVPFSFRSIGRSKYTCRVKTDRTEYSIAGSYQVAGIVIKDDNGRVLSGEEGPGVELGTFDKIVDSPRFRYNLNGMGFDRDIDLSDVKITVKELKGEYLKAVKSTEIGKDFFTFEMAPYRVGTGQVIIMFEIPSLELDGETFMTSLSVKIDTSKAPPCVAYGGKHKTDSEGYIKVRMFNLLAPPAKHNAKGVTLTVGDSSAEHDSGRSSLSQPDQIIAFRAEENGEASVFCLFDSEERKAVVLGDKLTISDAISSDDVEGLAVDNTSELPPNPGKERMGMAIRMLKYSPKTLTMLKATLVMRAVRDVVKVPEKEMAMVDVKEGGSAVITLNADIERGTEKGREKTLVAAFEECRVQKASEEKCEDMELSHAFKVDTSAVSGTVGAGAGVGLAAWSIALIAVGGAIVVLLVVVLSLWVVYRRSAEESESDYSSSGPLGVPDPDDMLYQQSIVRDIYGRGDFENGGPTAAAAEERAREADLREEFARPPSTSNASRDQVGTDEASSTYTM